MNKKTILITLILVTFISISCNSLKSNLTSANTNVKLSTSVDDETAYQCSYIFTTNWDKVEFQVRTGNAYNCANKNYKGTYTLYKGESLTLSGDGLCWRRRSRPSDSRSNWSNWINEVMCTRGRVIKVRVM